MTGFLRECIDFYRLFFQNSKKDRTFVLYVENRGYYPYLEDLVRDFCGLSGFKACCLTSERSDPLLSDPPAHLKPYYLERLLPLALLLLDAKVFLMTLTDLHQYHLRRSVRGALHVYAFHAMVSTHMIYRAGAFDHYDAVFCVGPHHVVELQRRRQMQKLPPQKLVEAGYPWLDRLMRSRNKWLASRPPTSAGSGPILIAPSWGSENIMETCILELARALAAAGRSMVVRPHPEWIKRNPESFRRLSSQMASLSGLRIDQGPLSDQLLFESDLLITDWSGIALEYAFGTERPVLFLDLPRKINNPDYSTLGLEPLEVQLRTRIGKTVPWKPVSNLLAEVDALEQEAAAYRNRIVEERKRWIFHLGESSRVGAHALLDLCEGRC